MQTINTYYGDQTSFADVVRWNHDILFAENNTSMLVQIFCGVNNPAYIRNLCEKILDELPMACIIGATTFGEIMNGEVSGLATVVSITVFQHTAIRSGAFPKGEQEEFALGRHIAATLGSNNAKVLILFGTDDSTDTEQVLKGIEQEKPQLLVAGGKAGNNSTQAPSFVFYNQDVIDCGFVGVVLEGIELTARLYSHIGWQTIGKEMTITEVEANRVYTINGIPAYHVYRRYLGIDKCNGFQNAVEFPLIVNRNGFLMARTPRNYYDDDSIGFFGAFIKDEKVKLSFGDAGLISEKIEELCEVIQKCKAESLFVYSCESRRGYLQELSHIETKPLQKLAPTAGFFTTGEFFHEQGINRLLNATMTVLVLAESGEPCLNLEACIPVGSSSARSNCLSFKDRVAGRNTGVLKALTQLINTVTAELEAANQDLTYIGLHDSLTGVYNRTFFDQEMARYETEQEAIGIVVCDLDCLKLANDSLGHGFGDRMIRLLANALVAACRKNDIVARIGGDEFVILIVGTTEADLKNIAERIMANAQAIRKMAQDNLLYISVGSAYRRDGGAESLQGVFTAADNEMYKNKAKNRKKVRQDILNRLEELKR